MQKSKKRFTKLKNQKNLKRKLKASQKNKAIQVYFTTNLIRFKQSRKDIPSSNFSGSYNTKKPKRQYQIDKEKIFKMVSIPKKAANIQNFQQKIHGIEFDPKFQDLLGPDIAEIKKMAVEKKAKDRERRKFKIMKMKADLERKKQEEIEAESRQKVKVEKPTMIFQDKQGTIRDEKGNALNLKAQATTKLKVNINKNKEAMIKKMFYVSKQNITALKNTSLFDSSISTAKKDHLRKRKRTTAFQFIEKGSIIAKVGKFRKLENQMDEENHIMPSLKSKGLQRVSFKVKHHNKIPDVEWWDVPFLKKVKYHELKYEQESGTLEKFHERNIQAFQKEDFTIDYKQEKLNDMIYFPEPLVSLIPTKAVVIPTFFSTDERKKMRRLNRKQKHQEKQDKIQLGIIQAPPPKLTLKNFMKVLGTEALIDPSKAERIARIATEERLKEHMRRNAERKLTKEQKIEKLQSKFMKDSQVECRVALFRIQHLKNRKHKYKVDINAKQLYLHGMCLIPDVYVSQTLPILVVVEGGPNAVKAYKKLMLRRIK